MVSLEDFSALKTELFELKNTNFDLKLKNESLLKELLSLKSAASSTSESSFSEKIKSKITDKITEAQLNSYKKTNSELEEKNRNLIDKISKLEKEFDTLKSQQESNTDTKGSSSGLKKILNSESNEKIIINELNSKISNLENKISIKNKELNEIEEKAETLNSELKKTQKSFEQVSKVHRELAEKAEFLERSNIKLIENMNEYKNENYEKISKLVSELDEKNKLLKSKETDINFLKCGIIQDFENTLSDYQKMVIVNQQRAITYNKALRNKIKDFKSLKTRYDILNKNLGRRKKDFWSIPTDCGEPKIDTETNNSAENKEAALLTDLMIKIGNLQQSNWNLEETITQNKKQLKDLSEDLKSKNQMLDLFLSTIDYSIPKSDLNIESLSEYLKNNLRFSPKNAEKIVQKSQS